MTDKTGTLTKNEMTVTRVWLSAGAINVTGVGYEPTGSFETNRGQVDPESRQDLMTLIDTGLVCNHAQLVQDDGQWRIMGDPTEGALIVTARKAGRGNTAPRKTVGEFSFDSKRQRMTIIEESDGGGIAHVKGAPEVILERCTRILDGAQERELAEQDKAAFAEAYDDMARDGLRTLALARRATPLSHARDVDAVENQLTLLGMVGIIDPPRPEVPHAIELARTAGIRVVVVTGDAPGTASAVARDIGLAVDRVITGREFEGLSENELRAALEKPGVLFARATPEQKLRIAGMLQEMGHVVGMTGDGVNDAPALKRASIGIAMGKRGTDVAKSASDMILTDDNFASIIGAVEEGRRQYENIKKFVRYLLSSNAAEVVAIFVNVILGGPLIFLPVQILWMNLVTDSMTAVALGVEPAEKDVMKRPPRKADESPVGLAGFMLIFLLGGYMGLANLWLFHHYLARGDSEQALVLARTVAFVGLIVAEKMNVFNFRSLRAPMPAVGFLTNPWVLAAWTFTIGLQVFAVYTPFMQRVLHITPLGWAEWGWIVLLAAPVFLVTEAVKGARWARERKGG